MGVGVLQMVASRVRTKNLPLLVGVICKSIILALIIMMPAAIAKITVAEVVILVVNNSKAGVEVGIVQAMRAVVHSYSHHVYQI